MKNKKKLVLVICLIVALLIAGVVGALHIFGGKGDDRNKITFEGVEEIHAPAGTVTEEALLAGVTAKDSSGNSKKVSLDLGGADLSKPGRYIISYVCGDEVQREVMYLYGDISFLVNDQVVDGSEVEIPFSDAIASLNFTKTASATDSFGNELTVEKLDGSDSFDYLAGTYTVKYSASDKAGQRVEKTITYTVTSSVNMTVQDGVSVKYEDESVTLKLDLDGEKDVWLMEGNGLVSIVDYEITDKGLTLKASYYRTLTPGEHELKLCSVNGSTVFKFTVVDTGKPIFTFDSVYKTFIITGNAAVYGMPETQIVDHEYDYTFKVTKNGVTYKAQQVGDSVLFLTAGGKNLAPGMYDVAVTATNKADTSKKTTIVRDFRIYTNQTEIDGWTFGNDGNGSTMVKVDLSKYGYYRTSYDYNAKSPNSWNGRTFWKDAKKATFQYITLDFYVYSLGVASKENGPVSYVGKNGNMVAPFSSMTMGSESCAIIYYDRSGKVVLADELKMNTWYTMKIDTSELQAEKTDMALYPGISNKWQVGMYITEMHFWAYETPEAITVFKDADKTVSLQRNGGKSSLVSGKLENESVMSYTVATKHIPGTAEKRALKLTLLDSSKEVISVDFKYLEDVKDAKGNVLTPSMYVQNCDDKRTSPLNLFGANYVIVDKDTGAPCAEPEVGKWYTLYITTSGNKNFKIFPMGRENTQLTCKIAFKDLTTYDVDVGHGTILSDSGNIAPSGLYKTSADTWEFNYASYTGWDATDNTAYYRRIFVKLDSADYSVLRFKFKFSKADYKAADSDTFVQSFNLLGPNITIVDENYEPVAAADRKLDTWYMAIITTQDGSPLPASFEMYPMGYLDGGKDGAIVNVEMQFKDVTVKKGSGEIPVFTNSENTVSMEAAGTVSTLTKAEEADAPIRYQLTSDNFPYTAMDKGIRVKLLDTEKQVISIQFTVNTCESYLGEPVEPWVRVETGTGCDGNYVVTDENGNAVKTAEIGKTYTLWITSPENARNLYGQSAAPTEFVVYLSGKDSQQTADISITQVKTYAVDAPTAVGGELTYATKMMHANAAYYLVGEKWNFSYASYTSLYQGSPVSSSNSAENREFFWTVTGENIQELRFKLRFVEGSVNGSENYIMVFAGHNAVFYKDGTAVTASAMTAGQWYDVVISKSSGNIGGEMCVYGLGYANDYPVDFHYQIADIELLAADPNPVKLANTEPSWISLVRIGTSQYRWSTTNAVYGGSTADNWQRTLNITNPLDKTAVLAMDFKFTQCQDSDGNPIAADLYAVNSSYSPINYAIMEKDTGKIVGQCEIGKEYTIFVTAGAKATVKLYLVQGTRFNVEASVDILDRAALELPETGDVTLTPNSVYYGTVQPYKYGDVWGYAYVSYTGIQSNHAQAVDYRHIKVNQTAGAYDQISFEFKYDVGELISAEGVSSTLVNKPAAYGANVSFYNMDGTAAGNLVLGTWYKAVYTPSGATFGSSFTIYPMGYTLASGGANLKISMAFRNFAASKKPDILVTTSAQMAQPVWQYTEADGWHWYVADNGASLAADNRRAMVTLPTDGMRYLTYEVKFNSLNGTSALMGLTEGTVKYFDLETNELVGSGNSASLTTGKWYRVEYATNNNKNMGTSPWIFGFAGGFSAGNVSFSIRNMQAQGLDGYEVTFDLNYPGATGAPTSIVVDADAPYGSLPTPEVRTNYTFGGWYKDAACTQAVTKDTIVTESHTLYAKWTADAQPDILITTSAQMAQPVWQYTEADGWHWYVADNGASLAADNRRAMVTLPTDGMTTLTYEVKFNSLNGTSATMGLMQGVNKYFDVETGAQVTSCSTGKWYRVVYTTNNAANMGTSPWIFGFVGGFGNGNASFSVRNVAANKAPDIKVTTSAQMAQPVWQYTPADGWHWYVADNGATLVADNRHANVILPEDGMTTLTYEVKFNSLNGVSGLMGLMSGTNNYFDVETGALVGSGNGVSLTTGKWYRVVYKTNNAANMGTGTALFGFVGGFGNGNASFSVRNVAAGKAPEITVTTSASMGQPVWQYTEADGWHWYVPDNGATPTAENRQAIVKLPEDGARNLIYEVKFNSLNGTTGMMGLMEGTIKYYDLETNELVGSQNSVSLTVGKWYRVEYTTNENKNMGTTGWTFGFVGGFGTGNASFSIRNMKAPVEQATFTTPGTMADPTSKLVDGDFQYEILGSATSVAATERVLNVTLKNGNANELSFEVKFSNKTGRASNTIAGQDAAITLKFYDLTTNEEVTALEDGTWYKAVYTKTDGSAFGTDALDLGKLGGTNSRAGGVDVHIRNVAVATNPA